MSQTDEGAYARCLANAAIAGYADKTRSDLKDAAQAAGYKTPKYPTSSQRFDFWMGLVGGLVDLSRAGAPASGATVCDAASHAYENVDRD